MPDELWARLFENAADNIGILVYSGFFLAEQHVHQIELLKKKADDGASIRILLGDPDCPQVALRGQEEDIGDAIAAKIRNVLLAYYRPYASHPGYQDQAALHNAVQLDLLVRRRHARQHARLRSARALRARSCTCGTSAPGRSSRPTPAASTGSGTRPARPGTARK